MNKLSFFLQLIAITTIIYSPISNAFVVNQKKYRIYASKKTGTDFEKEQKWFLDIDSLMVTYNSDTNYRTLLKIKKCPYIINEYGSIDTKKCTDLTEGDYYDSKFISTLYDSYKGKEYLGIAIEAYITMGVMPAIKKFAGKTVLRLMPKFAKSKIYASMAKASASKSINKNISKYANQIKTWVSKQNLAPIILKKVTNGAVSVTSWLGKKIVSFTSWIISFLILMEAWRIIDPFNTFANGAKAEEVKFQQAKKLLEEEINNQYINEDIDEMGNSILASLKIVDGRWFNKKELYKDCDRDKNKNPVIISNSNCYVDPILEAHEYNTSFELLYHSGMDPR